MLYTVDCDAIHMNNLYDREVVLHAMSKADQGFDCLVNCLCFRLDASFRNFGVASACLFLKFLKNLLVLKDLNHSTSPVF